MDLRRLATRVALFVVVLPTFALLRAASPAGAGNMGSCVNASLICSIPSSNAVSTSTSDTGTQIEQVAELLPVNRWTGTVYEEYARLPGGFLSGITNMGDEVQRGVFVGTFTPSRGRNDKSLSARSLERHSSELRRVSR